MNARTIAEIDAAIAAGKSVTVSPKPVASKTTPVASQQRSVPVAASSDEYPAHWNRTGRTDDVATSAESQQPSSGAGVEYPAHWDTSPVDGNATPEQAARPTGTGETTPDSGAGTEYPAHWKR